MEFQPRPPTVRKRMIKVMTKRNKHVERDAMEPEYVRWKFIKDDVSFEKHVDAPVDISLLPTFRHPVPGEANPDVQETVYSRHLQQARGRVALNNALTNPLPKIVAVASDEHAQQYFEDTMNTDPDSWHPGLPPCLAVDTHQSDLQAQIENEWNCLDVPMIQVDSSPAQVMPNDYFNELSELELGLELEPAACSTVPPWGVTRKRITAVPMHMKSSGARGVVTFVTRHAAVVAVLLTPIAQMLVPRTHRVRFAKRLERKATIRAAPPLPPKQVTDFPTKLKSVHSDLEQYWQAISGDPTSKLDDINPHEVFNKIKLEYSKKHPISTMRLASSCPEELQNLAATVTGPYGYTYTVSVLHADYLQRQAARPPPKKQPLTSHAKRFHYGKWYIPPVNWDNPTVPTQKIEKSPLQQLADNARLESRDYIEKAVNKDEDLMSVFGDSRSNYFLRLQERQHEAELYLKKRGLSKYKPAAL